MKECVERMRCDNITWKKQNEQKKRANKTECERVRGLCRFSTVDQSECGTPKRTNTIGALMRTSFHFMQPMRAMLSLSLSRSLAHPLFPARLLLVLFCFSLSLFSSFVLRVCFFTCILCCLGFYIFNDIAVVIIVVVVQFANFPPHSVSHTHTKNKQLCVCFFYYSFRYFSFFFILLFSLYLK